MTGDDDVLSTVLGGVSIGCWIVVYSPQIIENYQRKSGEGLSVLFVIVWLLGDLCNLFGAVLAGLLPTVIILALYYTLCDIILLIQIYFYRSKKRRSDPHLASSSHSATEESPLLDVHAHESNLDPERRLYRIFAQYAGAMLFVCATGVISWWISTRPQYDAQKPSGLKASVLTIQLIGWTSAILYLGSRVPQIFKNFETKCEGLSPGLFVFAISGNITYALSIMVVSMERQYLARNGSWLAGSILTIFLDIFVLCQFFYYRSRPSRECRHGVITES